MKMSKKLLLALAAILIVIGPVSFFLYQRSIAEDRVTVIRLAMGSPSVHKLPCYIASEMSFFKSRDIKIRPVNFGSDRESLEALEKGEADVALVSTASLILKNASDLKENSGTLAFASLDRGMTFHLVARNAVDLEDIAAVKNKTIITGPPDSEDTVFLEKLLRNDGLKPYETVTLITNIPNELKVGVLQSGTGNYIFCNDKDLPAALDRGLFSVKTFSAQFPAFVCVTEREFIKQNPEDLQRFTNALYMAQIWLKYHTAQETAKVLLHKIGELDTPSFPKMIENYYQTGNMAGSPVIEKSEIDSLVHMFNSAREIAGPVKFKDLVYGQFASMALKTVKYVPSDKQDTLLKRLKFWQLPELKNH